MRRVRQPGPKAEPRILAVPARALPIEAELPAGRPLLEALAALLAAHGGESACLSLSGGALGPFAYVIPAEAPDSRHAAFYSATFRPAGAAVLEEGAITLGWRDGAPFFHAHALWTEADGARRGGHLLPEETVLAGPVAVRGVALRGARFLAVEDAETGFRLFEPRATEPPAAPDALALRLRPHQDITAALVAAAQGAGFVRARLAGGVGSLVGARFLDAPAVESFATEMFLGEGWLEDGLGAGLVDMAGAPARGRLVPGDNPVLMTLEVVLVAG